MLKKLLKIFGTFSIVNTLLTFPFCYIISGLSLRISLSLSGLILLLTAIGGCIIYLVLINYTAEMFPKEEYVIAFPDDIQIEGDYD